MKILLLEDDYNYKISIKEILENLQYEVEDFDNGFDALDAIFATNYDLLLLDIRVDGPNGYEITKEVRNANLQVPIIFVTSLGDINNLSLGYELGCNDYLRKPFSMQELIYRVEETLKRYHFQSYTKTITLTQGYYFDVQKEILIHNNQQILLTENEKKLLMCLIKHSNTFISCDFIKDYVWENQAVGDSELRMTIKKIRDKTTKTLIQNIRGLGYKIEKK